MMREGDYNAGLPKQDNKGDYDTRTPGTGTNKPQAAGTNYSTDVVITGVYPYWYGVSSTQPTVSSIQDAISGGTANMMSSLSTAQNGTLYITFNASSEFLWFAHYENYAKKQSILC